MKITATATPPAAAPAPNPEEMTRAPRGHATLYWQGDPAKPDNTLELQGFGRPVKGQAGGLGNVIHQAARMVGDPKGDSYLQAQGVFEAATGAYEIRAVGIMDVEQGDIITIKPLTIDPPADGSGYVPTRIESHDPTLKAIVGDSRFVTFGPGETNGVMQKIISGLPGQSYPPTSAISPRPGGFGGPPPAR